MGVNRLSIVKFLELAIAITCVGLHYESLAEAKRHTIMLASGTFVGFTVILVGLFVSYLVNTPLNKRIDIFYSLVGCAMFVASGILIIQEWDDAIIKGETRRLALSKGSLAIINGSLFLFDVFFTFKT